MLSIVIPALNERLQIGGLLDSIVAQTTTEPLEVIVADAGSIDGTREFVMSYADKLTIQVVQGGVPPVARNSGARAARGEILLFCDADAAFSSPTFLAENLAAFKNRGLSIGAAQLTPKSSRLDDWFIFGLGNISLSLLAHLRPVGSLCLMIRRDVFEKAGGYPESHLLCEEHDLVNEAVRYGTYGILPQRVLVSVRRFQKEGRALMLWKYTYASFYRLFFGPITKPIFNYEFSYTKHENT